MELKSKVQELEMLEIEIPALVETKEGKLLGGFCTIATTGNDVFVTQNGCNGVCNDVCQDGCVLGTCQDSCKDTCNNTCNKGCQVSPAPTKDTTPTKSTQSLVGFSFVF